MMHPQRTAKEAAQQRVWHLVVLLSGTSPTITRAAALWELDRDDEAAMEYEAVWRDSCDIAALGPLSRLWSEAGNFGALEQVLEEALELGYTFPALRLHGNLHADLGRVQEAESDFRAAAAAGDDNAWAGHRYWGRD